MRRLSFLILALTACQSPKAPAGDFNGDGVVTDFSQVATGLDLPSEAQRALFPKAVDPDLMAQANGLAPATISEPASIDLSPKFPVALNQGDLGSCAAFADAAAATYLRNERENASLPWASPAYLYSLVLSLDDSKCDEGTWIHWHLDMLVKGGAPTIDAVPYSDKACVNLATATVVDPHDYRIGGWFALRPLEKNAVREVLAAGLPVVLSTSLPENFDAHVGVKGKDVFKSEGGKLGNEHGDSHAMVIVGYDDAKNAYCILNSWGADFGDGGFMWWDYDDLDARGGDGYVPLPLTQPPKPFSPVDAGAFAMTIKGALASDQRVLIGVQTSEPLQLKKVAFAGASVTLDQWIYDGFVTVPQAASGTIDVTFEGLLRDGTAVTRTLPVMVQVASE